MKFKKGIGPVIAVALLIVVSVVAVIGFQSWFRTYSSEIYIKTEKESKSSSISSIETIVEDQLYFKGNINTSIKKILIDGKECSFTGNISGVTNISIADCLNNLSTSSPEVVVVLEDKVLSKKIYLKDIEISSSSEISVTHLKSESECRFKDNKTGCEDYYVETEVDGISVIEDSLLGLYWQKDMNIGGMRTWQNAQDYCNSLGTNWRLPTLVEVVESLVDVSKPESKIVDVGFPANLGISYWTNTKYSDSSAYRFLFDYGFSVDGGINFVYSVVCVKTVN